jgi:hypothetical protein
MGFREDSSWKCKTVEIIGLATIANRKKVKRAPRENLYNLSKYYYNRVFSFPFGLNNKF